ncbi:hypothetical protein BaRGS_00029657 [Batillaria attramentaria]|uniref:Uncharacterized protein n=1 Tax=Batillaria attramentaria TaxID=370345 RepID=A0ABD0JWV8_9CAEN
MSSELLHTAYNGDQEWGYEGEYFASRPSSGSFRLHAHGSYDHTRCVARIVLAAFASVEKPSQCRLQPLAGH